ncbi:MAG: O-antigen ligase family protein [Polaromonas sp.]|nr:O-antigen ligase family protein [Polaromonas sp.]
MKSSAKNIGYALLLGAIAVTFGTAAALLPSGMSVRFFLLLFIGLSFIGSWALRTKSNSVWHKLIFFSLAVTISFSVLWPRYIFLHISGMPSVNPLTLGTMGCLYLSLVSLIFSPNFSARVVSAMSNMGLVPKWIAVYLLWRLLTCFLGETPALSVVGFVKELVYINSFILFGYIFSTLENGGLILFRLLTICGVLVGLAGIYEAFAEHNLFSRFASAGEDGDVSGTLANIAAEKVRAGSYRAQSTFDHPIVFAQFVAALIPISIYGILREKSLFWRLVALASLPIALLSILKSGSRAGIVSVVVAFGLVMIVMWLRALVHGRLTKIVAFVSLPALLGGIGLGYMLLQELTAGRGQHETSSSGVRMLMLRTGINALADSPIFGFGQGQAITKAGVLNVNNLATIDNYFLSIALDSGYVGLALFVLVLVVFSFKSLLVAVKNPSSDGLFVGACLASVLAIAATFAGLSIINNMTLLWLLIAATAPYLASGKQSATTMAVR